MQKQETFTIDDLGNRDSVNPPRRGNNPDYTIDNLTNRRDSINVLVQGEMDIFPLQLGEHLTFGKEVF